MSAEQHDVARGCSAVRTVLLVAAALAMGGCGSVASGPPAASQSPQGTATVDPGGVCSTGVADYTMDATSPDTTPEAALASWLGAGAPDPAYSSDPADWARGEGSDEIATYASGDDLVQFQRSSDGSSWLRSTTTICD